MAGFYKTAEALAASFGAIVLGAALYGVLFESTGGEPFFDTIFGACMSWPLLLLLGVAVAALYRSHRAAKYSILTLDGVLFAYVVMAWLIVVVRNIAW